jgi:MFS family permease
MHRSVEKTRWYREVSSEQWKTLVAALAGYMLDAMDFVLYLMAITTLQDVFQYGTDTSGQLATVALLASAVGGVSFGVVADRFGRTQAMVATILIFSLGSLGTATAQDLTQLVLWRAMVGVGVGGEWASGAVLVTETWPVAHRDKAISIMQSGWALGYLLAALIAAAVLPTLGWRWLFAVGALPALLVLWVRRDVKESAVWLARRQSGELAVNPWRLLFSRALVGRTVQGTLLIATVMFAYWGLFTWLPAFLASPVSEGGAGMQVVQSTPWIVVMQVGAFFGYLSFGLLADRIGRRAAFILFLLAAAVLAPTFGRTAHDPTMLMVLAPVLGFFGHGYFSVFGSLLGELFPTAVRATGQAFAYSVGRGLSALAPTVVGMLAKTHGIGPALAITSFFFLAGVVMILLVPNAAGKALDD